MKKFKTVIQSGVFLFLLSMIYVISPASAQQPSQKPAFDEALAKRLGADEYGMKKYVIAFLKQGPDSNQNPAEAEKLQQAHLKNIMRMADEGTLILAGPFMDGGNLKGIYIFNVTTIEEAKKLTETDPAIKAGRLSMDLRPWYGSAALMEVMKIHKALEKKSVTEQ